MTHTPHRILPRIAHLPTRSSGLSDGSRIRKGKQWPQFQLEEKYLLPPLLGSTPEERAETRMWQRRIERRITKPLYAAFHYGPAAALYRKRILILPECVPGLEKLVHYGLLWLDVLLARRTVIVPHRFTVVDIVLYTALDFGSRVGQPYDRGLRNLHVWFTAMDNRPSAPASLHPKAAVTGMGY